MSAELFTPPAESGPAKPETTLGIKGRDVSWEGWQFRWSIHPRNGLVLENVSFDGRSVLKYAGLAEIFVPYNRGLPRPEDFTGGIGSRLIELTPGKDCVPSATACLAFNARVGALFITVGKDTTHRPR